MGAPGTTMLTVYLDACCLQRPLDDQTQARIRVETEAILAILTAVQTGAITMTSSEALEYEISRIPDEQRRYEVLALLSLADERLTITDAVERLAETLEQQGIHPMDAIHLALASHHHVDFFATSDDALLRRARHSKLSCRPLSILELLQEINP